LSAQIDWDFAGDDDAKAEISAAVRYLLKDAVGNVRGNIVRQINEIVRDAANGPLPPLHESPPQARTEQISTTEQIPTNGITYKAYVIDAFRRDTDRWRANIRRLNGKKIRVAVPPAVLDEATTSSDALTAEKAVEFAKKAIDDGGLT
jgi:hypothetical protein